MINISRALKQERLMKALTGVSPSEFRNLLVPFEALLYEEAHKKPRQRKFGGGSNGALEKSPEQKLFFALFYLKVYPTYDVAGFVYDVDRSCPCKWAKKLLPILRKTLGRELVFPERQIHSVEEFLRKFPVVKDLFIDGTERPRRRPKKGKTQRKHYSGKKKRHTRKNIVWSDEGGRILLVSPSKAGSAHDKRLHDKNGGLHAVPDHIHKWTDTGFLGIQNDAPNVHMPKKSSKHHPLTEEEKEDNRIISGLRVLSEHALCGMKRFQAVSDVYRNHGGFDDLLVSLSAGLWNFHLRA